MKMTLVSIAPDVIRIILDGRLDITGASTIDLQFNAVVAAHRGVIVDLAAVTFLASLGIRTLLIGAKTIRRRGGRFVLLNPVADVEQVVEVTGVKQLMPIYRDDDAAVAAVSTEA